MAPLRTQIPIYGIKLVVVRSRKHYIAERLKVLKDEHEKLAADQSNAGLSELLEPKDGKAATLLIGIFAGGMATLVHEVAHGTIKALEHVGIPITDDTSEAFCYLHDWLFTEARKRG